MEEGGGTFEAAARKAGTPFSNGSQPTANIYDARQLKEQNLLYVGLCRSYISMLY